MKKWFVVCLSLIITLSFFSGCESLEENNKYVEVNITKYTWVNSNDNSTIQFADDATVKYVDSEKKLNLTGTYIEGESGTVGTISITDPPDDFTWDQYYIDSNEKLFLHDGENTSFPFTKVITSDSEEEEVVEEEVDTTLGGNVYYSGDIKLEFIEDNYAEITYVEGNVTGETVTAELTTIEGGVQFDGNNFRFNDEKGTVHANGTITMQGYDEPFVQVELN